MNNKDKEEDPMKFLAQTMHASFAHRYGLEKVLECNEKLTKVIAEGKGDVIPCDLVSKYITDVNLLIKSQLEEAEKDLDSYE